MLSKLESSIEESESSNIRMFVFREFLDEWLTFEAFSLSFWLSLSTIDLLLALFFDAFAKDEHFFLSNEVLSFEIDFFGLVLDVERICLSVF